MASKNLPPGKYIIDKGTGAVLHAHTHEPVSLTEEQQKIIMNQVANHCVTEFTVTPMPKLNSGVEDILKHLEHPGRVISPQTKLTVTVGDLMDFCAWQDSRKRWELYDEILEREGLRASSD